MKYHLLSARRPLPLIRRQRAGVTLTETLVAATLLVTALSVVTQMAARCGRLRQDGELHQVALEELSNQLDRLLAMADDPDGDALRDLTLSAAAARRLPGAQLRATQVDDAQGRRLLLELSWDRGVGATPLSLVAWLPATLQEERQP